MWRRLVLSVALVSGCVWCLAAVQQAQSQERPTFETSARKAEAAAPMHARVPQKVKSVSLFEDDYESH